jgi:hypothetical protein
MALMPSIGEAPTGHWVTDGMPFYLLDASDGLNGDRVLGVLTVQVGADPAATGSTQSAALYAQPNPVAAYNGAEYATTTLTWNPGTPRMVEVHVNSPDGPLFARTYGPGTASTGAWVADGMVFYLVDVSQGAPITLATTTMKVYHY